MKSLLIPLQLLLRAEVKYIVGYLVVLTQHVTLDAFVIRWAEQVHIQGNLEPTCRTCSGSERAGASPDDI